MDWFSIVSHWLHLGGAAVTVGGYLYAWLVVTPSLESLPAETRRQVVGRLAARMRPLSFVVIGVMLATGLINLMLHFSGKPAAYHMVFGVKLLLALHVFAVGFLLAVPPGADAVRDARRPRLMAGAAISGVVILLLSAWLNRGF